MSEMKEEILQSERERFVRWLILERNISKRIAMMYSRNIVRMLRKLDTMIPTKQECEAYRDNMLLAGYKSGYVLQIVKAIRHYGNYLNRDLKIKYPKKDKPQLPNFLTESELKQLLYSAKGIKERLVLMLMSVCGLRINEVCKLKVEDIKFDEGTISVPTSKTESRWELPVSNDLLSILRVYIQYERPNTSDFLILNDNGNKCESCSSIKESYL